MVPDVNLVEDGNSISVNPTLGEAFVEEFVEDGKERLLNHTLREVFVANGTRNFEWVLHLSKFVPMHTRTHPGSYFKYGIWTDCERMSFFFQISRMEIRGG